MRFAVLLTGEKKAQFLIKNEGCPILLWDRGRRPKTGLVATYRPCRTVKYGLA